MANDFCNEFLIHFHRSALRHFERTHTCNENNLPVNGDTASECNGRLPEDLARRSPQNLADGIVDTFVKHERCKEWVEMAAHNHSCSMASWDGSVKYDAAFDSLSMAGGDLEFTESLTQEIIMVHKCLESWTSHTPKHTDHDQELDISSQDVIQ